MKFIGLLLLLLVNVVSASETYISLTKLAIENKEIKDDVRFVYYKVYVNMDSEEVFHMQLWGVTEDDYAVYDVGDAYLVKLTLTLNDEYSFSEINGESTVCLGNLTRQLTPEQASKYTQLMKKVTEPINYWWCVLYAIIIFSLLVLFNKLRDTQRYKSNKKDIIAGFKLIIKYIIEKSRKCVEYYKKTQDV
jgi:hypothetical protein